MKFISGKYTSGELLDNVRAVEDWITNHFLERGPTTDEAVQKEMSQRLLDVSFGRNDVIKPLGHFFLHSYISGRPTLHEMVSNPVLDSADIIQKLSACVLATNKSHRLAPPLLLALVAGIYGRN